MQIQIGLDRFVVATKFEENIARAVAQAHRGQRGDEVLQCFADDCRWRRRFATRGFLKMPRGIGICSPMGEYSSKLQMGLRPFVAREQVDGAFEKASGFAIAAGGLE